MARLPWATLVRANGLLELTGRLATSVLVATLVLSTVGIDVRDAAQDAFNSGRPLRGVLGYAVVFPLLGFVALRSGIGFLRWRIQRELWRREVDGRTDPADPPDVSAGRRGRSASS